MAIHPVPGRYDRRSPVFSSRASCSYNFHHSSHLPRHRRWRLTPYGRALRRFSNSYGLIVENSHDGIWLTDSAARTTFVNARMTELLGLTVGEMIGAPISAFLYEEAEPVARDRFTLRGMIGERNAFDVCFRRKDGSPLWTETTVKPIHDADGAATGVIAMVADATERRCARLALAESEWHLRIFAEAMPHGVFIADPNGTPEYRNRTLCDYLGLTEEQSGAEWASAVHPDDAARVLSTLTHALKSGEPYETQLRIRRASDGMYRWFVSRTTPVCDASGAIVKWIGSCADIHDFRMASETRSVLETIGHIISIRNDDGSLEYVSPSFAQYTGTLADAGATPDWCKFIHPDDLKIVDRQDRDSRESPLQMQQNEIRVRTADGSYRWFLARTVALDETAGMTRRRLNTLTDIDDLKQAQAAFGNSESRYHALTDAMPQMVWILNEYKHLEYVNERWSTYTGIALESGLTALAIFHPDDLPVIVAEHGRLLPDHDFECEVRLRRHDGTYRWHLLRAVPLAHSDQVTAKWILTATDIQARKSAESALEHSAAELLHRIQHDPLTNLPNRSKLMDRLAQMIAEAKRDGSEVVVLYLDIDHFKTINDNLGHNAGDMVLVKTAARITSALRDDDTASRFGGDEFVLACSAASGADAARIAERLQAAVHGSMELNGKRIVVSCSIGISVFPHDGRDPADLIQKADSAMYAAKKSGGSTCCLYSQQIHLPTVPALEFEVELREAIALDQFVVYYQPIISVESGRPVGAEALVRWAHPVRGLLPPSEFITFAENYGLIAPIGELVLHAACAQLQRLNLSACDDFSIAVNVSARHFAKPGFVAMVASAIAAYALDARRLGIEITESVAMGDTAAVIATLDELGVLGVKLSLDDFGTGYSSLAYIKNFPIHTLKIDRSFVSDIAVNVTDQAIAKTIITLAHSLGMRVVAEGVETAEQLDLLRSFGVDCTQGYLVSRPLSSADFGVFLARFHSLAK